MFSLLRIQFLFISTFRQRELTWPLLGDYQKSIVLEKLLLIAIIDMDRLPEIIRFWIICF